MTFDSGNRLIAALDVPDKAAANGLIAQLGGVPSFIKLGLELFCALGPTPVREYTESGHRLMLDLKLHDIPATVGRATERLAALGAALLTVHSAGGVAMMEAAVRAAGSTRVLAVTVLTSLDEADLRAVGITGTVAEVVTRRAKLAVQAGCHGVVASPHEVAAIRAVVPANFLIVTPGVRPAGTPAGDQKRIMTPAEARVAGADLIVVGRPLRDAADPATMARAIVADMETL